MYPQSAGEIADRIKAQLLLEAQQAPAENKAEKQSGKQSGNGTSQLMQANRKKRRKDSNFPAFFYSVLHFIHAAMSAFWMRWK